jgi:hypothetical protein
MRLPVIVTFAPSRASFWAMASPIPVPPPVTKACLPYKVIWTSFIGVSGPEAALNEGWVGHFKHFPFRLLQSVQDLVVACQNNGIFIRALIAWLNLLAVA